MMKRFHFFAKVVVFLLSLTPSFSVAQTTAYEQLTSIADIDENARYVLGLEGTGFHYSGTSSWGLVALPSVQSPIHYTLTKAADASCFTAKATISGTEYYLQIAWSSQSNTFSMGTTPNPSYDYNSLVIGTTCSGTPTPNYGVAHKEWQNYHLRIGENNEHVPGLRTYHNTTGTMAYFYKEVTVVSTETELRAALDAYIHNIRLANDITLSNYISIYGGYTVTIDLDGHTLSRGLTEATYNGDVIEVYETASLTMMNGTLTGGYNNRTGEFSPGCIYNNGTVTLTDVTITGCKGDDGGAIRNQEGAVLAITGGVITGCESLNHGGGAIVNYGTANLSGNVTITGNSCHTDGGGIWNNGTLRMEGNIQIKDNTNDDLYLKKGKVIDVTGAITGGAGSIKVRKEGYRGQITNGYSTSGTSVQPFEAFRADINKVSLEDNECYLLLGYYECAWDEDAKQVNRTLTWLDRDVEVDNLTSNKYASGGVLNGNNYAFVVDGTASIANGLTVAGNSKIILFDGSSLSVGDNGIEVESTAVMNIYGEAQSTGKLIVNVDSAKYLGSVNYAGIGSKTNNTPGRIVIHGGYVESHGGKYGAGIGGGYNCACTSVVIYGGIITANGGEHAAGIGNGKYGDGGTVNIYGGDVTAKGGPYGAGIGSGYGGRGSTVTISGGSVHAIGGQYASGIGSGHSTGIIHGGSLTVTGGEVHADGGYCGAGIGGGMYASGATVVINGGEVYANGGQHAAGIGSGKEDITSTSLNGGSLTVTGGYVYASGKGMGAGIGAGENADGATVNITGGTVIASAGSEVASVNGSAIGSEEGDGHRGSLSIGNKMMVHAGSTSESNSLFSRAERVPACYSRPFARIEPCNHSGADIGIIDGSTHNIGCSYCAVTTEPHTFGSYGECDACHLVSLADRADNSEPLSHWDGSAKSITLTGRTLYKDGDWNTLTLPFALGNGEAESGHWFDGTLLEGATVMELDTEREYEGHQTGYDADGTLYLYFKDATGIAAGRPYLVKWESGENIVSPVFTGVTVSNVNTPVTSSDGNVAFCGNYSPVALPGNDASNLYLGTQNKLYWPSANKTVNAFRAYFHVALDGNQPARNIVMNLGEEEATIVVESEERRVKSEESDDVIYNLSGQKVDASYKGIVIKNGKKVIQ